KNPVRLKGVLTSVATNVVVSAGSRVDGTDAAPNARRGSAVTTAGQCTGNAAEDAAGVVARSTNGGGLGAVVGASGRGGGRSVQAVLAAAAVRGSVHQDPNFPIKHTTSNRPPFAAYPDSFFVLRHEGDRPLSGLGAYNGRGVLIVTGSLGVGLLSSFA